MVAYPIRIIDAGNLGRPVILGISVLEHDLDLVEFLAGDLGLATGLVQMSVR